MKQQSCSSLCWVWRDDPIGLLLSLEVTARLKQAMTPCDPPRPPMLISPLCHCQLHRRRSLRWRWRVTWSRLKMQRRRRPAAPPRSAASAAAARARQRSDCIAPPPACKPSITFCAPGCGRGGGPMQEIFSLPCGAGIGRREEVHAKILVLQKRSGSVVQG